MRRQIASVIDRPQPLEQANRLSHGDSWWRIQKGQITDVFRPPPRQIQRQTRQVAIKNFRPGKGGQGAGLGLVPEPEGKARLGSPCPAPALIGPGAADPHRLQPC